MSSSSGLCDFLDLVDVQSEHQRSLHEHLANAFLALSREGYRDPSSALRLASLAPTTADTFLTKEKELEFSAGPHHSPLAPLPSAELREAIASFRAALKDAVDVVRAREKVYSALDAALKEVEEQGSLNEETDVKKDSDAAVDIGIETISDSSKGGQGNDEDVEDKEGEWQVVR